MVQLKYPPTAKGDQVDDYHGTQVPDPYRWLEDTYSPETNAWIEAQNKLTFAFLEAVPERGKIQAVLFEGEAEVITKPRKLVEDMSARIYLRYLGEEGVKAADPQSWIHDAENLVVRLTPQRVFTW